VIDGLVAALELQRDVAVAIDPDDLRMPSGCDGWTVRAVLDHSIGVTTKLAAFAAGDTDEPHAPAGDLVGSDHVVTMRTLVEHATRCWASVDLGRTCRLPFGTFTADEAAGINLFDVLAHTWDVAHVSTTQLDADDPVWDAGRRAASRVIGERRDPRHYAPELPAPPAASPMARFLAYLGRDPLSRS
jgi:uncharacterized protein (TIGR03086 family)